MLSRINVWCCGHLSRTLSVIAASPGTYPRPMYKTATRKAGTAFQYEPRAPIFPLSLLLTWGGIPPRAEFSACAGPMPRASQATSLYFLASPVLQPPAPLFSPRSSFPSYCTCLHFLRSSYFCLLRESELFKEPQEHHAHCLGGKNGPLPARALEFSQVRLLPQPPPSLT